MASIFIDNYATHLSSDNVLEELTRSGKITLELFSRVPSHLKDFAYAENKWTVKQVLRHLIDCERIFACRALRFSRNDKTPLPGFDENIYMENLDISREKYDDLVTEFDVVRKSTLLLFGAMPAEMLLRTGQANEVQFTVKQLGLNTAGHSYHHCKIVTERYL